MGSTQVRAIVYAALIAGAGIAHASEAIVSQEAGVEYDYGYGFLKTPKYSASDPHFEYINPHAPKGGTLRLAEMGYWDSFNPIALGGRLAVGTFYWVKAWRYLWDSLLRDALDEPASYYGLIAEGVKFDPENGAWVAFKLREEARWHDGRPITVEDVVYTFDVSTTVGRPEVSEPLKAFSHVEVTGPREVKFHIKKENWGNPILPIRAGSMPILPKHYWSQQDISKTTVQPPLGSGPYRIGRTSTGRWIEWQREVDYWAKDLPVNRGHWNFDTIRWEYFRDNRVQTEAVKAHIVDIHVESVPRAWTYGYDSPALDAGHLIKRNFRLQKPAGLWWPLFFNLDVPKFQDIRVREALWNLSQYEWGAKRSGYYYDRATSFFQGSELAATGLPSALELELLEPLRHLLPPRVFTQPYQSAPENNRESILRAQALLEESGWVVRDHKLVHRETDEPFTIRMLAVSASLGRAFVPFAKLTEQLGIKTTISAPEVSNWQYRIRTGDFDIGSIWFLPEIPPTDLLARQFHSSGADFDYSYNWANMRDPAVDALIAAVGSAETWDQFVAACRALDRVLLWNFYFVPGSSYAEFRLAHWDKFGRPPEAEPLWRNSGVMTWWYDEARAARVLEFVGD